MHIFMGLKFGSTSNAEQIVFNEKFCEFSIAGGTLSEAIKNMFELDLS